MWAWRYEGVGELTKTREGRRFVASLFLSLAILFGGMAWTMRVGRDCNGLYHALSHARESLERIQKTSATANTNGGATS